MEPVLYSNSLPKFLGEDALHTLKCSICLDYFEKPVVLTCGHTFCLSFTFSCIQDTANYALGQHTHVPRWKVLVNCPECRRPFNASKIARKGGWIPSNYPLASLINTLQQATVPLQADASSNTESSSISRVEVGTQTSTSALSENDMACEYDVKQLDALEQAIIKACQSKDFIEDGTKNRRITTDICTNTSEKTEAFMRSRLQHSYTKEINQTELKEIFDDQNSKLETSCFEQTYIAEHDDIKTTNITNLNIDPEVLKIYNTLI